MHEIASLNTEEEARKIANQIGKDLFIVCLEKKITTFQKIWEFGSRIAKYIPICQEVKEYRIFHICCLQEFIEKFNLRKDVKFEFIEIYR